METKDILLCGVGGQGTVLASKLLAQCAINRGLGAHGRNDRHGPARRLRRQPRAHRRGRVAAHSGARGGPDLAFEPAEAVRCLRYLKPGGAVVTNSRAIKPVTDSLGSYSGDAMLGYLRENIET